METKRKRTRRRSKKTVVGKVGSIRIRLTETGQHFIRIRQQGRKLYEAFDSREAARLRAEQLNQESIRHGLSAFELTPRQRLAAKEALRLLGGRVGLEEAVRFWCDHHPDGSSVSTADLVDRYMADMEARRLRGLTVSPARSRLARFV
ncbi:MAG TPA: hypothetical protein PKE33_15435, partial [Kiritimatiellia bacterium]|nr:hypothetical protein [Kiritimatiellia bacterium]